MLHVDLLINAEIETIVMLMNSHPMYKVLRQVTVEHLQGQRKAPRTISQSV